jgi:hypothetical protein
MNTTPKQDVCAALAILVVFMGLAFLTDYAPVCAETEPIPPQASAEAATPPVTPPQAQRLTVEQAFQNIGGAVNGFLTYAPTNDAQRKRVIDSYDIIKAALDRLAQYDTAADKLLALPETPQK